MKQNIFTKKNFFNWITISILAIQFLIGCAGADSFSVDGLVDDFADTRISRNIQIHDAIASSQDRWYGPENTIDRDLDGESRWSALGRNEWIQYDLGSSQSISSMDIVFYRGSSRQSNFSINLSSDGNLWRRVYNGSSSGHSDGYENFNFSDSLARYVRVTGYGNSRNDWNSIIEVRINRSSNRVCNGDYRLNNATDLNNISNCSVITGDVHIIQSSLTNLQGLGNLRSIQGILNIYNNSDLSSLDGLSNLTSVGRLSIGYNPELSSISGLSRLSSVGGNLSVYNNDDLNNVNGLNHVTSIEGGLFIWDNDALQDLNGVSNVSYLGESLYICDNSTLPTCEAENIGTRLSNNGWSGESTIQRNDDNGTCTDICEGNYNIRSLTAMNNLRHCRVITGDVNIVDSSLSNLNALTNLESIEGFLNIYNNSSLSSLEGFRNITHLGRLSIGNNPRLNNVTGFRRLTSIGGNLSIYNNSALISLGGFRNVTSIEGGLYIWDNNVLRNLEGMGNLSSLGESFYVSRNRILPTCEAKNLVSRLRDNGWNGRTTIQNNDDNGTCGDPCTVNLSANPVAINEGGSSRLSWTSTNAASFSINNGIGTVTGSSVRVYPTSTTTYTITAAGPGGTATDRITVYVRPAPTVSISANPRTINRGQSSNLSWRASNATSFRINNGIGTVTGNSITVRPISTTTYVITATGPGGSRSARVNVYVRPMPEVSIGVEPRSINQGESATLSWRSANADTLSIDNSIGTVTGNSVSVRPSSTTTYTITATGPGGTASAIVTVYVRPLPTVSLRAYPRRINQGQSSTLSWRATNAASLSIDNGIGNVTGNSITVRPSSTTTYTITATNSAGSDTASITVHVTEGPIVRIRAYPQRINQGQSSNLSWRASNTTSLSIDNGIGNVTGNSITVRPSSTTTYTITATGPGGTATDSVTVYVRQTEEPTVSISASPQNINQGESSTLTWTSANTTSLSIDNGIGNVTGNSTTVNPTVTTTYTITAAGPAGTASDSVTVTVSSGPEETQPLAHWRLDEGQGNIIVDSSGNNHDGTFIGTPQWTEGVSGGYALDLSDDSGYVEAASINNPSDFYQERFTIATWLTSDNADATAAYIRLPGSWQVITEENEWRFAYFHPENGLSRVESGYTFPAAEEWHHYAVTVDVTTGNVQFFVDGVELEGEFSVENITESDEDTPLFIGQFSSGYRWNGNMDDVRFYDTVLSAEEIYLLSRMNAGNTLQPGINDLSIEHDDQTRNFTVHAPENYSISQSYPLVLCLHRRGGDRSDFHSSMNSIVNDENIIGVYPQGTSRSWNTGFGYEPSNANDVDFIQTVLSQVRNMTRIDSNRIFVLGISNGGGMSYRLALNSSLFAGAASVMYSMYEDQTIPASTANISILQIHGNNDDLVPFDGGSGELGIPFESAESSVALWGDHNNGINQPQVNNQSNFTTYDFPGEYEVILYELHNIGHYVPSTIDGMDTYEFIWEFFSRNSR